MSLLIKFLNRAVQYVGFKNWGNAGRGMKAKFEMGFQEFLEDALKT